MDDRVPRRSAIDRFLLGEDSFLDCRRTFEGRAQTRNIDDVYPDHYGTCSVRSALPIRLI
jgi:hypothetical protein